MKIIKLLIAFHFFFVSLLHAQAEFFVTVNPSTGSIAIVNGVPGVNWIHVSTSTFDNLNQRYIFLGADANLTTSLITLDANTGAIIANPLFPTFSDPMDNVLAFEYSTLMNKLYAIHWNNSDSLEYFVSVNELTGALTIIDTIPGVYWVQSERGFDNANQQYIFKSVDGNGSERVQSIDVNTGTVVYNPYLQYPYSSGWQFSNSTSTLYALRWDSSLAIEFLMTVNKQTGTFTTVCALPGVVSVASGMSTFDEQNEYYIFQGWDNNGVSRLYSVDVNTGTIVSSPVFPVLVSQSDNVIEIESDSLTGTLYALHWSSLMTGNIPGCGSTSVTTPELLPFPNPTAGSITIPYTLPPGERTGELIITNLLGQEVRRMQITNAFTTIELSTDELPAGSYLYHLQVGDVNYPGSRFVVGR